LVCYTEPDASAELVLCKKRPQRGGQGIYVDHLAIANDVSRERCDSGALDGGRRVATFHRRDVAGFDIEADE
jgi:hypothetical protein